MARRVIRRSPRLHPPNNQETRRKRHKAPKRLATRYYQLKIGHAAVNELTQLARPLSEGTFVRELNLPVKALF